MDLKNVKGIGPKTLEKLNSEGIYSEEDLIFRFPKKYDIFEVTNESIYTGNPVSVNAFIVSKPYFIKYRGTGTYEIKGEILSSLLGNVNTISKLVTVTPFRSPYKPEIGHVIIGRVISVNKKSWDVDIFAQRYGTLNLTAINLPRGEQRIRNEDDQMQMRLFFKENDLLRQHSSLRKMSFASGALLLLFPLWFILSKGFFNFPGIGLSLLISWDLFKKSKGIFNLPGIILLFSGFIA